MKDSKLLIGNFLGEKIFAGGQIKFVSIKLGAQMIFGGFRRSIRWQTSPNIDFRNLTDRNGNSGGRATDINANSSRFGTFAEALVLPAVPDGGKVKLQ